MGSSFTVFFDGTFWVGVAEIGEPDGSWRAARHVFGAEPSNAELLDFVRREGGRLIDRALASPPVVLEAGRRPAGARGISPKRAAREAARDQSRRGTSTAAQAALAAALEQSDAARQATRRVRRADQAERARQMRLAKAKAKHRGR